jgi:RHS repeat-associated protein
MKNGNYEYKLLYSGQLSPIAWLNDEDRVVEEYVYGSRVNVPEYMIKDGRKYRFITDHRGSVRMVVDTHTGEVVQETEYCEFGMIISETLAENWTPVLFGYAGGLQDRDTGLIRFGARDYDPMVGRWTSKEPLGFNGASNFYVYAENDPVNKVDPSGNLAWIAVPVLIFIDFFIFLRLYF